MSRWAGSKQKRLLVIICLVPLLSACRSQQVIIQGEAPSKATVPPTESVVETDRPASSTPPVTKTPEECTQLEGQLIEDSYRLANDSGSAAVNVYLPPCYGVRERDLPVAYFLHGYPQDQDHWIELGVIETYEVLLNEDLIDPMVLVFPYQPEPYFTQTDGGPGSFEELLLENVLPRMAARYDVSQLASERAILGVSRGGVWALEISMRHAEVFHTVAALSPALAYNHPRRAYDPFEIVSSADRLPEYIFLSAGDREPQFSDEIDRFAGRLEALEVEFEYLRHEGRHEDAAWETIMDQVLLFVGDAIR